MVVAMTPARRLSAGLAFSLAVASVAAQDWAPGLVIEGQVAFTEGPAWHAPTGNVYFTDIENNRILRRDPTGKLHVYRTPSGRANGLAFDAQGRLHACEGGGEGGNRRVTRTEPDGSVTVLTDRFEGKRYNSPNDLCVDARGRVWFTDPRYGDRSDMELLDAEGTPVEGVYRIDPDGRVTRVLTHEVDRPNGIALSPDGTRLFVADNVNSGPRAVGGARKLWRFAVAPDGSVDPASRTLLFDWGTERGPDGLALGPDGKVHAAAGFNFPNPPAETATKHRAGIYVFHPETGALEAFHAVPEDMITNCTFGGPDGKTLFITAGHKLWSLRLSP
jgi:gluconolactonase